MTTWLTQDAYDRLKDEYEELSTTRRAEVVQKIASAREEGDLKENGGYHAAREEQGKLEARIKQLRHLLESAQVGRPVSGGRHRAGGSRGLGDVPRCPARRREGDLPAGVERAGRPPRDRRLLTAVPAWAAPFTARRSAPRSATRCRTARALTVRVDSSAPFDAS